MHHECDRDHCGIASGFDFQLEKEIIFGIMKKRVSPLNTQCYESWTEGRERNVLTLSSCCLIYV